MSTPLFWHDFSYFCMVVRNGDKPLKLIFSWLVVFHPFGMSFKTQIKELRWISSMETKKNQTKKKNQDSKENREMRNHWSN